MLNWQRIWHTEYLGNSLESWTYALLAFAFVFTVLPTVRGYIAAKRRTMSGDVPVPVQLAAQLVARTTRLFLWVVALFVATRFLELPPRFDRAGFIVIVIVTWLQGALWGVEAVKFGLERRRARSRMPDPEFTGSLDVILFIARIAIFGVALLLALDNLGVNITAAVAGLGITGIAVALAVQTVLGDLLASLSITLDKPFRVGDFLVLGDYKGTVEHIGVQTTRLKSLSGEEIVLSNADVLKARLRNFGRMTERRVSFFVGVTYDTAPEKLRRIPAIVREIVEAHENTRFDRCHFLEWGDWSLRFEVVYFVLSSDFLVHANILQAVNLSILERFAAEDIQFAFPTSTVHARIAASASPQPEG